MRHTSWDTNQFKLRKLDQNASWDGSQLFWGGHRCLIWRGKPCNRHYLVTAIYRRPSWTPKTQPNGAVHGLLRQMRHLWPPKTTDCRLSSRFGPTFTSSTDWCLSSNVSSSTKKFKLWRGKNKSFLIYITYYVFALFKTSVTPRAHPVLYYLGFVGSF